jgi:hypothetical protein
MNLVNMKQWGWLYFGQNKYLGDILNVHVALVWNNNKPKHVTIKEKEPVYTKTNMTYNTIRAFIQHIWYAVVTLTHHCQLFETHNWTTAILIFRTFEQNHMPLITKIEIQLMVNRLLIDLRVWIVINCLSGLYHSPKYATIST